MGKVRLPIGFMEKTKSNDDAAVMFDGTWILTDRTIDFITTKHHFVGEDTGRIHWETGCETTW